VSDCALTVLHARHRRLATFIDTDGSVTGYDRATGSRSASAKTRPSRPLVLHQLQHAPLLLVQHPHQAAQLPHLSSVSTMHRAGLQDALQPLQRARAGGLEPPCVSYTSRSASAPDSACRPLCGRHIGVSQEYHCAPASPTCYAWGLQLGFVVTPLPPHKFHRRVAEIIQCEAGLFLPGPRILVMPTTSQAPRAPTKPLPARQMSRYRRMGRRHREGYRLRP
jgi:hypothetical protein